MEEDWRDKAHAELIAATCIPVTDEAIRRWLDTQRAHAKTMRVTFHVAGGGAFDPVAIIDELIKRASPPSPCGEEG